MLPKSHRLAKKDIERLFKKGKAVPQDFILVRYGPNRADHCRFAVIIPKKVMAKATDRNTARRQVYEYLAKFVTLWQNKNLDVSFSFRKFDEKVPEILANILGRLP